MTSLWRDRTPIETDTELGDHYDDVVVGAGITGLTTALLLARAGRRVAVVEARDVGAVTTGNTTGKVSLLQGTKLSTILDRQSEQVAAAYVDANREGQAWLLRFCEDHGVPFQRRPAITYAPDERSLATSRAEHDAATLLGLPVRWQDTLDVPFPHVGGTQLDDQAQVDAMDVLSALAQQLRAHGGTLVAGRRVVGVPLAGTPAVDLDDGQRVTCDDIVLATGTPSLDRGLYFAKLKAERSYALAFRGADAPALMMLSAGPPSRSVRDAPSADGALLLIGRHGHP